MNHMGYPHRPPFFALRFNRLMLRSCLGTRVGAEGCWLLAAIVSTEDARRYTGPVAFFNGNLADQLGISISAMQRARKKCVEAGWLHYTEGERSRPAKYWVIVPPEDAAKPDGPSDEGEGGFVGSVPVRFPGQIDQETDPQTANQSGLLVNLTTKAGEKRGANEQPSYPLPLPVPEGERQEPPKPAASVSVVSVSTTKPKKRGNPKPASAPVEEVPIPAVLDTPAFCVAWAEWQADRKERKKPLTVRAAEMQLRDLEPIGPENAILCIKRSISSRWTGLFPDEFRKAAPKVAAVVASHDALSARGLI